VPYLQDLGVLFVDTAHEIRQAHIQPQDLLTITVSSSDEEAVRPFNLIVPNSLSEYGRTQNAWSAPILQNYLVDADGMINFPVLGRMKVGGLTTPELSDLLVLEIGQYLKVTPIVTVRIVNYKVSILGEVSKPGVYTIDNERINIFEALARAGDLTIYGNRNNLRIIRRAVDDEEPPQIFTLNLSDKNIVYSPHYYLQQNDIVYVEPIKNKQHEAGLSKRTDLILRIISLAVSVIWPITYNLLW
jgi:polysaccharide export outer membrane protein